MLQRQIWCGPGHIQDAMVVFVAVGMPARSQQHDRVDGCLVKHLAHSLAQASEDVVLEYALLPLGTERAFPDCIKMA